MANCDTVPSSDLNGNQTAVLDYRQKRALNAWRLKAKDLFEISLNLPRMEPRHVNDTAQDSYNMLYHIISITEPIRPLLVTVYPMVNESLTVYVQVGVYPSPNNYTWILNVSGRPDDDDENSNHTIFISAADISSMILENATIIVGVQRTGTVWNMYRCRICNVCCYNIYALVQCVKCIYHYFHFYLYYIE